ncbi:MAG: amidohydrolase family protein [Myxococcota bacterium]|jgi:predicted TIM-barrel fold metal-dependent hydrolase|nr:amidohydrolase [Deltaproteobacteria bacterium]MCP4243017.1 amidohydrolase [bacterium]MDP7073148.1 amidohydrolase family protein [Myxococcota bacterium]MDP7300317.1 amidohydrolase family protein [Myxococcota bacterium]MDP7434300.1 amidohydrolase family protein [Myxococcota bacterium]
MPRVIKLGINRPISQGLLPDPEPCETKYTLISVDDHLVEPAHTFEGRLPRKLQDKAPRVIETDEGHEVWYFEDQPYFQVGFMCTAGRPKEDWRIEPARFEEIRPGCYQIDERIKDMDLGGIWASACFPSGVTGFSGTLFSEAKDPELGLACMRAWNDWLFEEWCSPYPERQIPIGVTFLADPVKGAEEIRRNADRGFRGVTLPERPHRIGLPSIFSGEWDPIIEACAETDTVINLHVASSGFAETAPGAPMGASSTLFGVLSMPACVEWLWSGYPGKYPNLKIALSEGGIGWVAMIRDRLENIMSRSGYGKDWPFKDASPSEVLYRNFWFCMIDDPSTISTRHAIGVDKIMFESDYPHGDGTWPDTQQVMEDLIGDLPAEEIRMIAHENAARLFRHPLPEKCLP